MIRKNSAASGTRILLGQSFLRRIRLTSVSAGCKIQKCAQPSLFIPAGTACPVMSLSAKLGRQGYLSSAIDCFSSSCAVTLCSQAGHKLGHAAFSCHACWYRMRAKDIWWCELIIGFVSFAVWRLWRCSRWWLVRRSRVFQLSMLTVRIEFVDDCKTKWSLFQHTSFFRQRTRASAHKNMCSHNYTNVSIPISLHTVLALSRFHPVDQRLNPRIMIILIRS